LVARGGVKASVSTLFAIEQGIGYIYQPKPFVGYLAIPGDQNPALFVQYKGSSINHGTNPQARVKESRASICPTRYSKGEMYGDKGGKTPVLPQHTVQSSMGKNPL